MSAVYSEVVHAAYTLQKGFKEIKKKNQVADQSRDSVPEKCASDALASQSGQTLDDE